MIKVLLVDDEEYALQNLETLIELYCPQLGVVNKVFSVKEAIQSIIQNPPDLIFLDIEMPNQNGFELLEYFPKEKIKTIFVSAHDKYAIKAFRLHALDYLLKPVDPSELVEAVETVVKADPAQFQVQMKEMLTYNKNGETDKICFPIRSGIQFVFKREIIYFEASSNYTTIYLKNEKPLLVTKTIKAFENVLDTPEFMRVHRAYIVNVFEVKAYLRSNGGELLMTNGKALSVSKSRLNLVLEALRRISASVG